jgi:hypothetical protein
MGVRVRDTLPSTSDEEPTTVGPVPADSEPHTLQSPEEATVTKTIQSSAFEPDKAEDGEGTVPGVPALLIAHPEVPPRDEHTTRMQAYPLPPRGEATVDPASGESGHALHGASRDGGTAIEPPYEIPGLGRHAKTLKLAVIGIVSLAGVVVVVSLAKTLFTEAPRQASETTPRIPRSAVSTRVRFAGPTAPPLTVSTLLASPVASAPVPSSTAPAPTAAPAPMSRAALPPPAPAPIVRNVPAPPRASPAPPARTPAHSSGGIVRETPF